MSSLDGSLISHCVKNPDTFVELQRSGVNADDFVEEYAPVWNFLRRIRESKGVIPSRSVVEARFPEIVEWARPRDRDLPVLTEQLQQRKRWNTLLDVIDEAATGAATPEGVDAALDLLQGRVSRLMLANGTSAHLVDLFERETAQKIVRELKRRKFGGPIGHPTGLKRLDTETGGLIKGRSYVLMGRTGKGKTWVNLLFVASAVIGGAKVMLYPLEMTLTETAFRLYTIFSQKIFGLEHVLKHHDLTTGHVRKRDIIRFLLAMEDKFAGQLYVADIGNLTDPYTVDRISAEVQTHRPDGFWIDYITLLKAPEMSKGGDDYSAIRYLSSGIHNMSIQWDCWGGSSAQVNREALRQRFFIPRLEHISYGDSIGHDADHVVSINRRGQYLYYAEVKDRHGPEIGTTRVKFFVNEGLIEETEEQGSEGDEDDE